jgi:hypothetical protein
VPQPLPGKGLSISPHTGDISLTSRARRRGFHSAREQKSPPLSDLECSSLTLSRETSRSLRLRTLDACPIAQVLSNGKKSYAPMRWKRMGRCSRWICLRVWL